MRLNCPALRFDILSKCLKLSQVWIAEASGANSRERLFCVFDGRDLVF